MKRATPGQSLVGTIILGALACWVFSLRASTPVPAASLEQRRLHADPATPVLTIAEHPSGDGMLYAKHESEARRFLRQCNQKRPNDRQDCLQSQRTFVTLYVDSFTGSFFEIVTLAGSLSPPTSRNYIKEVAQAVRPDPIEACAWWKLLSFTTAHNPEYDATYHRNCDRLSDANVEARLHQIGPQLGDQSRPPSGWEPDIPGLGGSSLITTVPDADPPPSKGAAISPDAPSLITAMPNVH